MRLSKLCLKQKNIINVLCLHTMSEMWYLDNSCSKHMTDEKSKFFVHTPKDKGSVTYGDNNKGKSELVELESHLLRLLNEYFVLNALSIIL
ncbi:hypothetical protein Lal_00038100 [Lupinus albus]|nr:hypothetical protein Lal_00038100 [Lupinus albus]